MTHYPRPKSTWTDTRKKQAQDTLGEAGSQPPGKPRRMGESVPTVNPPGATAN